MKFPCKACGSCCRNIPLALDRGDGTCRHYDDAARLCTVYEARPMICRVDKVFSERVSGAVSAKIYYMAQAEACTILHPDNSDMPERTRQALREAGLDHEPDAPEGTGLAIVSDVLALILTESDLELQSEPVATKSENP